ncbi:MAG: hypothetical protein RI953_1051 [Pseudomonadota bacterium]|jgi:hypothetical protein
MTLGREGTFRFLELVSLAAVANPFGQERDDIDKKIVSGWIPARASGDSEVDRIAQFTSRILDGILSQEQKIVPLNPEEQRLLEDASLFAIFHKYTEEFDQYILRQNDTPGEVIELPFADQISADLHKFGFKSKASHYISLFFQMRRAFFFVSHYVGGTSAPVQLLRERLWRTLFTSDLRLYISLFFEKMESFSVLLLGETGVGKGQVAAALGRSAYIPYDERRKKFVANFLDVFVSANISEYPSTLVESELFGHKKGSFTGALENHPGLFAQTHKNGVLFLDEIGELESSLQVKILRVLQERAFSPVGGHEKKRFSGRLIAATNANLFEKVENGTFRSDLFHRLASDVIEMPSLRQRFSADQSERKFLVSRVLERMLGRADMRQEERVLKLLGRFVPSDYTWPGNLREFEQVIRRLLLHGESVDSGHRIFLGGLGDLAPAGARHGILDWRTHQWTAEEVMSHYARSAYEVLGTYEKVAQKLGVDWRTAKRWIQGPGGGPEKE